MSPQINTTAQKLNGLDHLRALAITFVFLYHYQMRFFGHPQWVADIARFGWTGVDLFFVLSGFLISSQLFLQIKDSQSISLRDFFIKRILRILPAYFFVLAIYFTWPGSHEREGLAPAWKYLTFTQNIGLNLHEWGTFSHAWSLCVEEHFYFLLPFILLLVLKLHVLKRAYVLLIALFIGGFLIRHYGWLHIYYPVMFDEGSWATWYKYIYYPTYNRLDGLLVGVTIAAVYRFKPEQFKRLSAFGNLFLTVGLILLTCAYFLCEHTMTYTASIYGFPLIALGYGCLVMGAISPVTFLYKKGSKITTFTAGISYGIYLVHKIVIHVTQDTIVSENIGVDGNLMMLICTLCCVFAAALLKYAVETPFMHLKDKILDRP